MHPTPQISGNIAASAPSVRPVETPNPDARMFRVEETLIPTGTREYHSGQPTTSSPLAESLLQIDEVELVLIAPRFVTVRKSSQADWAWLSPTICAAIARFLQSGEMAVLESSEADALSAVDRSQVEQRILSMLDEEVRPAIAQDGGDVTFEGFRDGIVYLRLIGACGTCPSSTATLKYGIERLLMEEIPEVRSVESVA